MEFAFPFVSQWCGYRLSLDLQAQEQVSDADTTRKRIPGDRMLGCK
jgi:hypothetical protein